MINDIRSLIAATIERLRAAPIPLGLWAAFVAASMSPALFTLFPDAFWPESDWLIEVSTVLLIAFVSIALVLVVSWKLTRACADSRDHKGSVWAWLGWSLVAYLPALAALVTLAIADPDNDYPYWEMLIRIFLGGALVPLLVHASGRAIDANGLPARTVWRFWAKRYVPLFLALTTLTGPVILLSEIAYLVDEEAFIWSAIGGLVAMPSILFGIAMTVEAYHHIPDSPTT